MLTTQDLAKKLKVSPRRALALAKLRGVAPALVVGRNKLWHPGAVAKLKPGKPGRPPGKGGPKR